MDVVQGINWDDRNRSSDLGAPVEAVSVLGRPLIDRDRKSSLYSSDVIVGPIRLAGFEIPNCVYFGGSQRMAIHRLAGGQRMLEPLGPEDSDIWFSGVFTGSDAETRARAFDSLRTAGVTVQLTWQSFQYDVILRTFRASYRNPWWISYTAGLIVVRNVGTAYANTTTPASEIQADILSAMTALQGTAIDLSSLSNLAVITGALVYGSETNLAVANLLTQAAKAVAEQIATVGDQLLIDTASVSDDQQSVSAVAVQLSMAHSLASLAAAQAYISRALQSIRGNT